MPATSQGKSQEPSIEEITVFPESDRIKMSIAPARAGRLTPLLDEVVCRPTSTRGVYLIRRGGRIRSLIPRFPQRIPLSARFGEWILWRDYRPGVRLPPAAQTGVESVADARAWLQWMRQRSPKTVVACTDLMTDGPMYQAVQASANLGYWSVNDHPSKHLFHRFEESYDAFFQSRKSKYKNQLRKKIQVFEERMDGAKRLVEYRSEDEVAPFLEAAGRINRLTYQFNLFGEAIQADTESLEYCRVQARQGRFRSFILWHRETPVCFVLGMQEPDGRFAHLQTGFDPAWRECAPGINTNILMLQRLYSHDRPTLLDFGSGDADYKRLFANETRMSSSPILIPRTLSHALPYIATEYIGRASDRLVGLLERWGIKQRVKRLVRRRASVPSGD